jgi:hypothetical protein
MTLKQGEEINKSFIQSQKKLDSLKDSVSYNRFLIDSLNLEFDKIYKKKEEYKFRYEERLNMPMVKYQYHNDSWEFAQKMVLIGIIVLQFFTIK